MRCDWYWARWHVIKRDCLTPQWGALVWNVNSITHAKAWTLDVWIGKTLWTVRRDRY